MITASTKTWRRRMSRLLDHLHQVAVVGLRGDDHQRVGVLVGGDLHLAAEQVGADRPVGRRARLGGWRRPPAAAAARQRRRVPRGCPARAPAAWRRRPRPWRSPGSRRARRLRPAGTSSWRISGEDPCERARAGDHDQLVGPLLGDDLADLDRTGAGAAGQLLARLRDWRWAGRAATMGSATPSVPARRSRACAGGLRGEDLGELLRQLLRSGVLHRDDVDLLEPPGWSSCATSFSSRRMLRPRSLMTSVSGGKIWKSESRERELVQHVAHLVRFDVAELEELGDHLLGRRRLLPRSR